MFGDPNDPFLIIAEAAAELRMAKGTLDNHRCRKTGPKFRRHGGRIVYRLSDLHAWSEQRAVETAGTSRSRTLPSEEPRRSGDRPSGPGLAEGKRPRGALERKPEYPYRSLHIDIRETGEREPGDHPSP